METDQGIDTNFLPNLKYMLLTTFNQIVKFRKFYTSLILDFKVICPKFQKHCNNKIRL